MKLRSGGVGTKNYVNSYLLRAKTYYVNLTKNKKNLAENSQMLISNFASKKQKIMTAPS